jgi:hypothetical protein
MRTILQMIGVFWLFRHSPLGYAHARIRAKRMAVLYDKPWCVYYIRRLGYFEGTVDMQKFKPIATIKP